MILFPNCKINLWLDVLRKRTDGFHDIQTLMYPVTGLCDSVEIVRRARGVEFSQSGLTVDCPPEKNICLRAYRLMRERHAIGGVDIHLHKAIPFGAGLGGGSADASFVLRGLNELFDLGLTMENLESLAAELGSDTAFFVRNTPALCTGRGEIMTPHDVPALAGKYILIVKPDVHVSTAGAYAAITPAPAPDIAQIVDSDIATWRGRLKNDFEKPLFERYPQLRQIKEQLYELGAVYASMSGSGSALFGIFNSQPATEGLPEGCFLYSQKFG